MTEDDDRSFGTHIREAWRILTVKPAAMGYDDNQLAAVLIKCAGCGIEWYMTQTHGPTDTCVECRWKR
jgi:hypothetical protein